MKKNRLHTLSIVIGSLLALAIAFSQFLTPDWICSSDPVQETEQTKDKSTDETASFISLPSFSLPAPVNLQSNLDAYCLFEILFEDYSDEVHVEDETSFAGRFFQTMFQVIISPNAP